MRRRRELSPEVPLFLTRRQVAEALGCSEDKVDRLILQNKLKALRDGRFVRIGLVDLRQYVTEAQRWKR
jgi:excisionase family DNA binding protein